MKRIIFIWLLLILTACGVSHLELASVSLPVETTTPPPVQPTATVRLVMVATDPATFEQSAGRPQLVEFFAFW